MTNTTTPLTFTWRIQYSDDHGETWTDATGPGATGTTLQDESQPETANIYMVGCEQADIYADAHRADHPGRQWQAYVDDGIGHTLGVVANSGQLGPATPLQG